MSSNASSIFAIPCPSCADELTPVGGHDYQCHGCGGRYRMNVGYLQPLGAPTAGDRPS